MNALVIKSTDKTDLQIFIDLAEKLGLSAKSLTDEEMLDIGLLRAMEEGRKTEFVSREQIMNKLRKNGNLIS